MNQWQKPEFIEIRMDAEIGAYQSDDGWGPDAGGGLAMPSAAADGQRATTIAQSCLARLKGTVRS